MKNRNILKTLLAAPLVAFALTTFPLHTASAQKTGTDKPYQYVENMPAYKDGSKELMTFLASNIQYPDAAKANGLEGLVVAQFIVETDGSVKDVKVVRGLGQGTDEEAIRVIKMTSGHWTPGTQNDKAVRVIFTLPIKFTLSDSERAASADVANQMPQFKGGPEALQKTISGYLQLPEEAKEENLNARVVVKFYVEKDGTVSNIRLEGTKLKKTVGAGKDMDYMDASTFQVQNKAMLAKLAEAAMAAVAATSGQWEPATRNGQAAGAQLVLPVQFYGSEETAQRLETQTPTMTKYTKKYYKMDEVDVKPTFKEGSVQRFLAKNVRYPANTNFEGMIETGFVIKADGKIVGPLLYSSVANTKEENATIFTEIQKVIKLMEGKWTPAKVDGIPVETTQKLTIQFVVNDGTKKAADTSGKKPDVIVTKLK